MVWESIMRKLFIFVILILCHTSLASADDRNFSAKGSVRLRVEYVDGFNQKYYGTNPPQGEPDDLYLLQRIRLAYLWRPSENVLLSVGLQDARVYDMALPDDAFYNERLGLEHSPNEDFFEPFDTYLEIKSLYSPGLSLKGGRQIIAYGNNRVFGPGQWGNTGRYIWDAVKLSYKVEDGFIDTFYGRNIVHEPDKFSLSHRHFWEAFAIYSRFPVQMEDQKLYLEPFFVTKWDDREDFKSEDDTFGDFRSYSGGFRSHGETSSGFDYDLTFVGQLGDWGNDDHKAYGFHISAGYAFSKVPCKPRISAEFSYASGDKDPEDGDRGTFDGVFGARDKMYGRMNLMDWKNLQDVQINLELKPLETLSCKIELHKFWLAEGKDAWYHNKEAYRDITGNSGKELGVELDITATKGFTSIHGLEVQFGFGHFWPGTFVKELAGDVNAYWFFYQLQYTFSR
jgi:hypothetical protein